MNDDLNDGTKIISNHMNDVNGQQMRGDNTYTQMDYSQSQLANELMTFLSAPNMGKNSSSLSEFTTRGSWTQQEDEQLINAVNQLGAKKWTDIAKFVPTRTSKQCRERWHHRLDPSIKHDPFEPWEDQIIIEKQREIGNRWSVIAQQIPGRSASAIKNRWYSGLRSQHPTHAQMDISSMNLSLRAQDQQGGMGMISPDANDPHESMNQQNDL